MCLRSISLTELERTVCGIDVNSSEKNSFKAFILNIQATEECICNLWKVLEHKGKLHKAGRR